MNDYVTQKTVLLMPLNSAVISQEYITLYIQIENSSFNS